MKIIEIQILVPVHEFFFIHEVLLEYIHTHFCFILLMAAFLL